MRTSPRSRAAASALAAWLAGVAGASELHLFAAASRGDSIPPSVLPAAAAAHGTPSPDSGPDPADAMAGGLFDAPPPRRCVVIQCETVPPVPSPRLFTRGTTLWSAASVLIGAVIGAEGPIDYGLHSFSFTDEGFFGYMTYGGGSDKASHMVVSATVGGLLYDAYRLNGLDENRSFVMAASCSLFAGLMVEIGDGLTPYGFSAQDLTADGVGALVGALVKRGGFDDVVGFQIGKVPTTIPAAIVDDRSLFGIDYTKEMYGMTFKGGGVSTHLGRSPGFERFLQGSFVYFTKGYGYTPVIDPRYQEAGFEFGLNFAEIGRACGLSNETWWGDILLRALEFYRIPYTQVGVYYNFKTRKWYGPGAPYHFY